MKRQVSELDTAITRTIANAMGLSIVEVRDDGTSIAVPSTRKRRKRHAQRFPKVACRKRIAGRQDITLSQPAKMPCYGWSLTAGAACPASKLTVKMYGDAAVCSHCYADGVGNYGFPNVRKALATRMAFVRESLTKDNGDTFVATMVDMIIRAVKVTGPYFRIHDSGDFFHPLYVDCWRRIALALPTVQFWAPTREYLRPMMLPSLRALAALPNVSIRPSGAQIDGLAPVVEGLAAGSAVQRKGLPVMTDNVCPATEGAPSCESHGCRKCWDAKSESVTYRLH